MQKLIKLLVLGICLLPVFLNAQDINQALLKPTEGKSLVYFVRSNSAGFALNFRIYDKDKYLGALVYKEYLVYECDPGEHLFWAASENRDFVEANLAPNKVYILDVQGQMGAFIVGVSLVPLKPNQKQAKKDLYKIIKNEKKVIFNSATVAADNKEENIIKALEKYKDLKEKKTNKIEVLTQDMNFENANKPQ